MSDPYTFLNAVLQTNSNITSLLGHYQGGTIPLIKGGILAEQETELPAIEFYNSNLDQDFNLEDTIFTMNCYAANDRDSFLLARTVVKELKGLQLVIAGYAATLTPRILASEPDPAAKEVNTVVEVRLFNIGGAI